MPDMSKLVDLNGIAAVRDWANQKFSGGSSLPSVTSEDNGDLLSVVDGAWAKSEPGYRVESTEGTEIAAEQSVTTVDDSGYVYGPITATWPSEYPESITVTFNGTEYTLPKNTFEWGTAYGEYDSNEMSVFTNYPCCVEIVDGTSLVTETPGTYTVKVAVEGIEVVPTENFRSAVKACGAPGYDVSEVAGTEIIPEQSVTAEVVTADHVHADIFPVDIEEAPEKIVFAIDGTAHVLELTTPAEDQVLRWGQTTDEFFVDYDRIDHAASVYMPASMAGTHTISVSEPETRDVVPTEDFKLAVKQSGGGALIVNDDSGSLDKTWQEIFDAYTSGTAVLIRQETFTDDGNGGDELDVYHSQVTYVSTTTITTQGEETVTYSVYAIYNYEASSADDYPAATSAGGGDA